MTTGEVTDEETARQALFELKERRAELHRRYAEKRAELQAQFHAELQAQFSPEFEDFRCELDRVLNSIKERRTLSMDEAAATMEVSRQRLHQMRKGQQH